MHKGHCIASILQLTDAEVLAIYRAGYAAGVRAISTEAGRIIHSLHEAPQDLPGGAAEIIAEVRGRQDQ